MTTEEKYDKALELARTYYNGGNEFLDTIFPELKESEDERIRKSIIRLLQVGGYMPLEDKEKAFAYLEKQKEQNNVVLQEAFKKSKKDFPLEEKIQASDYAESILPTSVAYGENNDEYKLHKIIEAAYIAGQKEQKSAEWSEKDEEIVRFYEMDYNNKVGDWPNKDVVKMRLKFKDWLLNRLKFIRPQPRQEWSEEDEKVWQDIFDLCNRFGYDDACRKLKSLRPQPAWKPSEEQMHYLLAVINDPNNAGSESCYFVLQSLYAHLQKLL